MRKVKDLNGYFTCPQRYEWPITLKSQETDAGKTAERQERLYTVGNVNQFNRCGRQCGDSSRTYK